MPSSDDGPGRKAVSRIKHDERWRPRVTLRQVRATGSAVHMMTIAPVAAAE